MPEFRLRSWAEQTLYDYNDYLVTAGTIEEAAAKLHDAQDQAHEGDCILDDSPDIELIGLGRLPGVRPLDPAEVIDGDSGISLIDEDGNKIMDVDPEDEPGTSLQLTAPEPADTPTTPYRARWEIDVEAHSPKHAAEQALAIQRKHDSIATVFDVWETNPPLIAPTVVFKIDLNPEHYVENDDAV